MLKLGSSDLSMRFTLITRYAIARTMSKREDHAGAEAEYRAVLDARTKVLGATHPDTLTTARALKAMTAGDGPESTASAT
jgi:hypothetical protein